jgi:AbiU2
MEGQKVAGPTASMPDELAAIRSALWQDVVRLHQKWAFFTELYATQESIDLLNFGARTYFAVNQQVWADDLLLAIARLTDPVRSVGKSNLSFAQLLIQIDPAQPPELHDKVEHCLEALMVLCDPIRERRKKLLAHSDLDTRLGRSVVPLVAVTKRDISVAFEKMRDLMNEVERAFLGNSTMFEFVEDTDAKELLYCLREAREARQAERVRHGLPPEPGARHEA